MVAPAYADHQLTVTANDDSGEGSLRAALAAAADAGGGTIIIATDGDIALSSGLEYSGSGPLTLVGSGQTLSLGANETILAITQGADLTMSDLTLRGPGGYSIQNRGDVGGIAGKGIFVDIRDDQTGTASMTLTNVTVADVAAHGIHISDCTLADDCGGGGGGAGEGSPASISLTLAGVTVDNVGQGRFDADGLRVDERGEGDIHFVASGSTFRGVGADGVELDEGQAGDVVVHVSGVTFTANGSYCDPAVLGGFMPDPDEAEFDQGQMAEDAIPGPITGTPDDGCFEREVDLYDDGSVEVYEFGIDLDDGFDVDEAGPGSIIGTVSGITVVANLDEGLDFDEEDAGGIALNVLGGTFNDNTDDGIKLSELGDGDVSLLVHGATATGNGGKGIVAEEEDAGDLNVTVRSTTTGNNDDGDGTGIEAYQDGDGMGSLMVVDSDIADGTDLEGVEAK